MNLGMFKMRSNRKLAHLSSTTLMVLLGVGVAWAHDSIFDYKKAEADPAANYRIVQTTEVPSNGRGIYVAVHFDGSRWQPDTVFHSIPSRAPGQEVLYVSEDKRFWGLAVPSYAAGCPKSARSPEASYTLCNSAFGHFSSLGAVASVMITLGTSMLETKPVSLDEKLLKLAVLSVPESTLSQIIADDAQRQSEAWRRQMEARAIDAANQAHARVAAENAASERLSGAQRTLQQQPTGATLFCQTDKNWGRSPGDAVDRQRLVCHLAGQSNMEPMMGSWLLTNGWTIESETRRVVPEIIVVQIGTAEVTSTTLRKVS